MFSKSWLIILLLNNIKTIITIINNSIIKQYLENTDLSLLSIRKKLNLPHSMVRRVILSSKMKKLLQERVVPAKKLAHNIQKKLQKWFVHSNGILEC